MGKCIIFLKFLEFNSFLKLYISTWHTIKPGTPEHGTTEHGTPSEHRNSGGTLTERRNTGATPEHWQNNGTLAKKLEYHRKAEQEDTSGTMEQ